MGRARQKHIFWAYADSEGTDQRVHPRSVIIAFTVR